MRPDIPIIAGRRFASGLHELIVGRGAQHELEHLDLGAEVSIEGQPWRVVGMFDSGDAHNSELWGDMDVVGAAYRRAGIVNSIKLRLSSAAAFGDFKNSLQVDPRLQIDTQTTRAYYGAQSVALVTVIKIMAVDATFGALNATHTAISSRAGEIAAPRAIGFRSRLVITSLLLETMLLSLASRGCSSMALRLPPSVAPAKLSLHSACPGIALHGYSPRARDGLGQRLGPSLAAAYFSGLKAR